MLIKKILDFFKGSLKGYRNFFYATGMLLFFVFASAVAGLLLVYPLWLAATKIPKLFTVLFIIIIAAYGLAVLLRYMLKKSSRRIIISRIKPSLIMAGRILVPVLLLYPAVIFLSKGSWLPALPFCIAVFFLIGNILYGKKNRSRS